MLVISAFAICSCVSAGSPPTPSPTPPPPTSTPTFIFPTLAPTVTLTPEPQPTPTQDLLSGLGGVLYRDTFDRNLGWDLGQSEIGGASLVEKRLSLAVRTSNAFYYVRSPAPNLSDFFLEVSIRREVCSDSDEFGVMFKVNELGEHYRFALTCDDAARVSRILSSGEAALVPITYTYTILPGMLVDNRIAVWASGDLFRFYINNEEVFSARSSAVQEGGVALFVRSRRSDQTTVSFDNLIVRALLRTPTPTMMVSTPTSP